MQHHKYGRIIPLQSVRESFDICGWRLLVDSGLYPSPSCRLVWRGETCHFSVADRKAADSIVRNVCTPDSLALLQNGLEDVDKCAKTAGKPSDLHENQTLAIS